MRRIVIIIFATLVLISLDYFSKQYALNALSTRDVSILGEWIGFHLSYNPGIAFSLPITGLPLQIITIVLVI
jgi:signal peptidase II